MTIRKPSCSLLFPTLTLASFLLVGCELPLELKKGDTTIVAEAPIPVGTPVPDAEAVCNPFGGSGPIGREHGLSASLYYLDDNLPHYDNVSAYISNGLKLDATLFLDQVNVATRPFDEGFVTNDGRVLQTPAGNTLYEWFALDMSSELRLAPGDAHGLYQFALISDDGSTALYKDGDTWKTLVDNDGTHATRFKVGEAPISFDALTKLSIKLKYYQGPRMHIAAMLLWRPWPEAAGAWLDPRNGQTGNDLFFDSTKTPSEAKPAYTELLARGWKPVAPANYFLPVSGPANPCPPPPPPAEEPPPAPGEFAITGFDGTSTSGSVSLIWQTPGYPTNGGKIHWGITADNLDNTILENNGAPSTTHLAIVGGLQPSSAYFFQAESTDGAGNMVRSNVIRKTTK